MSLLSNKRIIVTGGTMGIGFAVAKKCAAEGASLILVSRHKSDLEKAVKEIGGSEQKHSYHCLDVSMPEKVKEMANIIAKELGSLDGLVNCAGIYGPIGKLHEVSSVEFVETIKINLLGTFYMCRYFIPLLKKTIRGKVVNYSGGGAAGPFPMYSAYSTSKIAIVKLTENIALELKDDNVDVNAVAPGFVVTRLHQETIKAGERAGRDFLQKTKAQIAKGGVSPDVAAALTVFLLSSRSDGITGKFISAPWDPWDDSNFQAKLKENKDFATLRRIDGKMFFTAGEV